MLKALKPSTEILIHHHITTNETFILMRRKVCVDV